MAEPELIRGLYPPDLFWRIPTDAKHSRGSVLIVGGFPGQTKPLSEIAEVCLALKIRKVTLAMPESLADSLRPMVADTVTIVGLPETPSGTLAQEGSKTILDLAKDVDIALLGEAISKHPETQQLISCLIPILPVPLVITDEAIQEEVSLELFSRPASTTLVLNSRSLVYLLKAAGRLEHSQKNPIERAYKERYTLLPPLASDLKADLVVTSPEAICVSCQGKLTVVPQLSPDMIALYRTFLLGLLLGFTFYLSGNLSKSGLAALTVLKELIDQLRAKNKSGHKEALAELSRLLINL